VNGLKQKHDRIGRKEEDKRERVFYFEKAIQPNEFKHSKTMHQHVCNSKLLYFII
jgi:hypothetical protein